MYIFVDYNKLGVTIFWIMWVPEGFSLALRVGLLFTPSEHMGEAG